MGSLGLLAMRGATEYLLSPFVEALSAALGSLESGGMHNRVDTQHQPATGRSMGPLLGPAPAPSVTVTARLKALLHSATGLAMKTDDVIDIEYPPHQDVVVHIQGDVGTIAAIGQDVVHGEIPSLRRYSRTSLIRYLSASWRGCGR